MSSNLRVGILRAGGLLLLVLGILHLAVTPHITEMIEQSTPADAARWLTPPMLLNHVVVGILLLPLGGLTLYAAPHAASRAPWALVITRATAVTIAVLPPTIFLLMGSQYFEALPFKIATGIATLAAVVLLLAAFWPPK
jgi:hypothetical protein